MNYEEVEGKHRWLSNR